VTGDERRDRAVGGPADGTADEPREERPDEARDEPREAERRRRRRAAVFGDVLPETTRDDRDPGSGTDDDWYRRNVPPHHG
jgi:hypothetical protein